MFEEVKKRLQLMSIKQVMELAFALNLPYSTLMNIRYGKTKDPSVNLVQKLHDHFKGMK